MFLYIRNSLYSCNIPKQLMMAHLLFLRYRGLLVVYDLVIFLSKFVKMERIKFMNADSSEFAYEIKCITLDPSSLPLFHKMSYMYSYVWPFNSWWVFVVFKALSKWYCPRWCGRTYAYLICIEEEIIILFCLYPHHILQVHSFCASVSFLIF